MKPPKNYTVIKRLFVLALLSGCATAFAAQPVGTVADLSGFLLAKTTAGKIKILAQQSSVEPGDTLMSEQASYARIKFIDNSEITLRPNSQLTIERFSFDAAHQENDQAAFNLIQGGLRVAGGLIAKRSEGRFVLTAATSVISIRDAVFIAEYVPDTASRLAAYRAAGMAALDMANGIRSDAPQGMLPIRMLPPLRLAQLTPPGPALRSPGLYVQVLDGIINLSNKGGSQNFSVGQFGYTPNFRQPPVVLPANPGILFTPPPAFMHSTTPPSGAGSGNTSHTVDCEVR